MDFHVGSSMELDLVESNDIKPITNDLGVCLKMGPPSGYFKGENDDKPSEKPDCTDKPIWV